jgi:hypothetical protein
MHYLWRLNNSGYYTVEYADDIAILINGRFLQTVSEVLQTALCTVQQRCERTNLSIKPSKMIIIPFTRKRNTKGRKEPTLLNKTIQLSSEAKYLGLMLDKGLTWKKHLDKVISKAYKAFWTCRSTFGKTWGLKPKVIYWIYTLVLRPIVICCGICWSHHAQCYTSNDCYKYIDQQLLKGNLFHSKEEWENQSPIPTAPQLLYIEPPTTNNEFTWVSETPFLIDPPSQFSDVPISVDKPNQNSGGMAPIYNTGGENDLPSTEKIHPMRNSGHITDTGNTSGDRNIPERISQLEDSPRTSIAIDITSSNLFADRGTDISNYQPNEHIQPHSSPTNIPSTSKHTSTTTNHPDNSGRKRKSPTSNIRSKRQRINFDGTIRNKAKQRRLPCGQPTNDTTMEKPSNRTSSPSPTTNTSHTIGTDNTDGSPNKDSTYTFIIHKKAFDPLPPSTKKAPTFASFDHGDIHFIFSVTHSNNASRHLSSILKFLHTTFEGSAEAHTTLQLIRFATRFISYLIRKGLTTFHKYGTKLIKFLNPLTEAMAQYDTTDLPTSQTMEHCNQYTEDKKTLTQQSINQRTFSIDYISSLITEHKITSYESFQRTLPTDIKIQLLKQLGYIGQNIIKTLIKIHTTETLQTIKTKHYYQLILDNIDISLSNQENVRWLSSLFHNNNINISDFFAKFIAIHSTNITKINTFVLEGPTNTGKSLLMNILLSDTKPTRIARERDKSNFHLDQLPNSTSVIFEEPIIDQTTVGTWKLLLEGAPIPTDMKHADKELIHRLPIFITTNQPLWNWVSTDDIPPLQQRLFPFKLTSSISSYISTHSALPQPPNIITKHDIYALILHHIQSIHDDYLLLLASSPISDTSKPYTTTQIKHLESLQIQLLLQDSSEQLCDVSNTEDG